MKWLEPAIIIICGFVILFAWLSDEGLFCPDCPEPVVDTEYYDSILGPYVALVIEVRDSVWWDLIERVDSPCADSIAVLNERLRLLERHRPIRRSPFRHLRHDSLCFDSNYFHDPCPGMVSIAAVDSLVYNDTIIDLHDWWRFKQARGL